MESKDVKEFVRENPEVTNAAIGIGSMFLGWLYSKLDKDAPHPLVTGAASVTGAVITGTAVQKWANDGNGLLPSGERRPVSDAKV